MKNLQFVYIHGVMFNHHHIRIFSFEFKEQIDFTRVSQFLCVSLSLTYKNQMYSIFLETCVDCLRGTLTI